jgi:predicted membrane protein
MKMSTGIFWALIFILIGLCLIIKIVFNVEFSIFRILFAFFFIYLGIKLFVGRDFNMFHDNKDEGSVIFSQKTISEVVDGKEYNVIFGGGKIDLSHFTVPEGQEVHIKLNTIFGGTQLYINPEIPIQIESQTVFGGTKMPNGNSAAFGSLRYENDSVKVSKPRFYIDSNTVFGGLQIKQGKF